MAGSNVDEPGAGRAANGPATGTTATGTTATGRAPNATAAPADRRSIGQLVAGATHDIGLLIRGEIQLAKAELQSSAIAAVKGSAMFIVAALLVALSFFMLCFAAAWGLVALGLHPAVAYLIVAVVFLLAAAVVAYFGLQSLRKIGPPTLTLSSLQETKALISRDGDDELDDVRRPARS